MLFFLSENNHHRRERRRVLAAAEFQAAFNEANFRFVVYVIVKKPCVSARRNKRNDNRSGLLRFFVTLPDPFARCFSAVWWIAEDATPPPNPSKVRFPLL
jgi:hypothetical protein